MDDEAIWVKYCDELTRYASALVGPSHAEDVLSTVVIKILRRRHLADLDEPRSYLYRAVLNECRSVGRRNQRAQIVDVADVLPGDVRPEVLGLPAQQRAAVYLYYWRDLPVAEVARTMGCRPGTVKRYLHLARVRLKGSMQ